MFNHYLKSEFFRDKSTFLRTEEHIKQTVRKI